MACFTYFTCFLYIWIAELVVETLTLLLRILGILGSNLVLETGYPDRFVPFLSPSMKMTEYCLK
jgi:hypothetical protein